MTQSKRLILQLVKEAAKNGGCQGKILKCWLLADKAYFIDAAQGQLKSMEFNTEDLSVECGVHILAL